MKIIIGIILIILLVSGCVHSIEYKFCPDGLATEGSGFAGYHHYCNGKEFVCSTKGKCNYIVYDNNTA